MNSTLDSTNVQGYVDFGRYDPLSYFSPGSGNFDFVQVRTSLFFFTLLFGERHHNQLLFVSWSVWYTCRGFTTATCRIVSWVMTNLDVQHRLGISTQKLFFVVRLISALLFWVWSLCYVQVNIICGNCSDGRCKGESESALFVCLFHYICWNSEMLLIYWKAIDFPFFLLFPVSGGLGCICSVTQDSTCRSVCYCESLII